MKRIFPLIVCVFIIMTIATIPTISKNHVMRTNLEIEKQTLPMNSIYLLSKEDYLIETKVYLPKNNKIETLVEYLKENHKQDSTKVRGYIPENTKILSYKEKNGILEIHFSEELKNMKKEYLPGIVKTFERQTGIDKVNLYIEQEKVSIPYINLEKDRKSRNDLDTVVVYYMDRSEERNFVPVTKYIEKDKNKIEVILEELKENIPDNLMSFVREQLEVIEEEEITDGVILNFNKELIEEKNSQEQVLKEIGYSILDSLDVTNVIFKVEGKYLEMVSK